MGVKFDPALGYCKVCLAASSCAADTLCCAASLVSAYQKGIHFQHTNIGYQQWVSSFMEKSLSILLGHCYHIESAVRLCTAVGCDTSQLCRYEDVLSPQDIYSLVGLTAFYNGFFGQCSQAFTRLESLSDLPEVSLVPVGLISTPQSA